MVRQRNFLCLRQYRRKHAVCEEAVRPEWGKIGYGRSGLANRTPTPQRHRVILGEIHNN